MTELGLQVCLPLGGIPFSRYGLAHGISWILGLAKKHRLLFEEVYASFYFWDFIALPSRALLGDWQ